MCFCEDGQSSGYQSGRASAAGCPNCSCSAPALRQATKTTVASAFTLKHYKISGPVQLSRYSDWLRGSNPGEGRDFPHLSRPVLGSTPPPVQWAPSISRDKERPGRDADPSPPSSAVVKKQQSYTSAPPMTVQPVQSACKRVHYTFFLQNYTHQPEQKHVETDVQVRQACLERGQHQESRVITEGLSLASATVGFGTHQQPDIIMWRDVCFVRLHKQVVAVFP